MAEVEIMPGVALLRACGGISVRFDDLIPTLLSSPRMRRYFHHPASRTGI